MSRRHCRRRSTARFSTSVGITARAPGCARSRWRAGVALNCSANGKLTRSGLFDEVYVQPAAGDDGAALGAALHRASLRDEVINKRFPVPFLGPSHSSSETAAALRDFAGTINVTRFGSLEETCERAAKMISEGKVIAWHRGRMEYGPRALGNRSILADASNPEMRDRVNAMVKKREAFRPFAPAVSIEQVHRWFDVAPMTSLPYMIATVNVREEYRATLPAITHVDGSARVQTVAAARQSGFPYAAQGGGKKDRSRDRAEHELQCERAADSEYTARGGRDFSRHRNRLLVYRRQSCGSSMTANDRDRLVEWNRTDVPFESDKCIHDLLEAQALRTPEKTAVICRDQCFDVSRFVGRRFAGSRPICADWALSRRLSSRS